MHLPWAEQDSAWGVKTLSLISPGFKVLHNTAHLEWNKRTGTRNPLQKLTIFPKSKITSLACRGDPVPFPTTSSVSLPQGLNLPPGSWPSVSSCLPSPTFPAAPSPRSVHGLFRHCWGEKCFLCPLLCSDWGWQLKLTKDEYARKKKFLFICV